MCGIPPAHFPWFARAASSSKDYGINSYSERMHLACLRKHTNVHGGPQVYVRETKKGRFSRVFIPLVGQHAGAQAV